MPLPDTMLAKLQDDYNTYQAMGNGGYAIGYYCSKYNKTADSYGFPNGKYTQMQPPVDDENGRYYLWAYDPKK